jgi:hypothetical protein
MIQIIKSGEALRLMEQVTLSQSTIEIINSCIQRSIKQNNNRVIASITTTDSKELISKNIKEAGYNLVDITDKYDKTGSWFDITFIIPPRATY